MITLRDLKNNGIFDLMPNGFNAYDYDTEEAISLTDDDYDSEVVIIGADCEEFIPALYIRRGDK